MAQMDCDPPQTEPQCEQVAQSLAVRDFTNAVNTPLYADAPWERYQSVPYKELALLGAGSSCAAYLQETYLDGQKYTFISKFWPVRFMHQWEGFFSELALYKSHKYLRDLQGDCIPRILKVMLAPTSVCIAMELPHRIFWHEASPLMPEVLKLRCVQAFRKLHKRGVLHGDVELRHMLIGGDGKVTLIDFQESRALEPNEGVLLKSASEEELEYEMRKVRFKLDYRGARMIEQMKIIRERQRREHNDAIRQNLCLPWTSVDFPGYEPRHPDDEMVPPIDEGDYEEYWCSPPVTDPHLKVITVPGLEKGLVARAKRRYVARVKEWEEAYLHRDKAWQHTQRAKRMLACLPNGFVHNPLGQLQDRSSRVKFRDFADEPPPLTPIAYPVLRAVDTDDSDRSLGVTTDAKQQMNLIWASVHPPQGGSTMMDCILEGVVVEEAQDEPKLLCDAHRPEKRGRTEETTPDVARKKARVSMHATGSATDEAMDEADPRQEGGTWYAQEHDPYTSGAVDRAVGWVSLGVISTAMTWLGVSARPPPRLPISRSRRTAGRPHGAIREQNRRGLSFWPF